MFYRSAYKTGTPYLIATLTMMAVIVAAELAIQLTPALKQSLDSMTYAPIQLIVLIAGLLIFALLNGVAYRRSAAAFERLDL